MKTMLSKTLQAIDKSIVVNKLSILVSKTYFKHYLLIIKKYCHNLNIFIYTIINIQVFVLKKNRGYVNQNDAHLSFL